MFWGCVSDKEKVVVITISIFLIIIMIWSVDILIQPKNMQTTNQIRIDNTCTNSTYNNTDNITDTIDNYYVLENFTDWSPIWKIRLEEKKT